MEIDVKEKRNIILIAVVLNLLIVISQIVFGIYGNSTALIVDAVHNLQDVLSLVIALIAAVYMVKKPTLKMTFGYLRAEALAGFVNSAFLIGAVFIIIITSIEKLLFPEPVNSVIVIVVGFVAFVINSLSAYFLGFHHHEDEEHHHEDLNIKAAYLHLLSDALISLGVVIGGILMYFFSIYWIDPVLAIGFSIYIFKETLPVLKKTFNILMEGVPYDVSLTDVKNIMLNFPEIKEVHDLHIWSLSSKDFYLSGHIVVEEENLNKVDEIIKTVENRLREKGINHITLQPETKNFKCENVY